MNLHMLYLSGVLLDNEKLLLSVESYICLFVYNVCDLKSKICFMDVDDSYPSSLNATVLASLKSTVLNKEKTMSENFNCMLPAVLNQTEKTYIAGLCAVLRYAIKMHNFEFPNHYSSILLGFREGCLVACSENSIWTKFCELQMPNSVKAVSSMKKCGSHLTDIPESLILLENHLKRPVRTHNILKRKLDIIKRVKEGVSNVVKFTTEEDSTNILCDEDVELTLSGSNYFRKTEITDKLKNIIITEKNHDFDLVHCYLEGIDMTLADLIVFPCVKLLMDLLPPCLNVLHHVRKWYNRMCLHKMVKNSAERCGIDLNIIEAIENKNNCLSVPDIDQISLYKRDPSHTRLKCKHQNPEKILSLLYKWNIHSKYSTGYCSILNWDSLPATLHPQNGDLPEKRLQKKCQQIESIVTALLKVVRSNQTIVEFCAGGGHVGLLLSYLLPSCKIVLVENKESSMMRAKLRAESLGLTNIEFYQTEVLSTCSTGMHQD